MTTYLTTDEAAERFRETPATIARRCAAGKIPASRIGRRWLIAEAVVESLLQPTNVKRAVVTSTAGKR